MTDRHIPLPVRDHLDRLDRLRNFGIDEGEDRTRHDHAAANALRSSTAHLVRIARELIAVAPSSPAAVRVRSTGMQVRSFVERVRFVRFSTPGSGSMVVATSVAMAGVAAASAGAVAKRGIDSFPLLYGGLFAGSLLIYYGNKLWEELDWFGSEDTISEDPTETEEVLDDSSIDPSNPIPGIVRDALESGWSSNEQNEGDSEIASSSLGVPSAGRTDADSALGAMNGPSFPQGQPSSKQPVWEFPGIGTSPADGTPTTPNVADRFRLPDQKKAHVGEDASRAVKDIQEQRYGKGAKDLDDAIRIASKKTGEPVADLYAKAYKESRFGRIVNSSTSSAQGVFQILPNVYRVVLDRYGREHPILQRGPNDVYAGALASALLSRENKQRYQKQTGRTASTTDSYVLYLMGHGAGTRFLDNVRNQPHAKPATDFPKQAAANRSIFFADKGKGRPLTYRQMYALLYSQVGEVSTAVHAETGNLRPSNGKVSSAKPRPVDWAVGDASHAPQTSATEPVASFVSSATPGSSFTPSASLVSTAPTTQMLEDAADAWIEQVNDDGIGEYASAGEEDAAGNSRNAGSPSTQPSRTSVAGTDYVRLSSGVILQL